MAGGCAIGGIRRGPSARGRPKSEFGCARSCQLGITQALHRVAVPLTKGDVEVRVTDLSGFFEPDPRIRVRGGEVWIDCEYLATNNKYDTRKGSET